MLELNQDNRKLEPNLQSWREHFLPSVWTARGKIWFRPFKNQGITVLTDFLKEFFKLRWYMLTGKKNNKTLEKMPPFVMCILARAVGKSFWWYRDYPLSPFHWRWKLALLHSFTRRKICQFQDIWWLFYRIQLTRRRKKPYKYSVYVNSYSEI